MRMNQLGFAACLLGVIVGISSSSLIAQTGDPASQNPIAPLQTLRPTQSDPGDIELLSPLPDNGTVPPIVQWNPEYEQELAYRARVRGYERQFKIIRHKYFGNRKLPSLRQQGFDELTEFTDPAAFKPMVRVLAREKDDVRLAVLDHLAQQDEDGMAVLAWIAITDDDQAIRHEASKRLSAPASDRVLEQLDMALRSSDHTVAMHAAVLAGTLDAVEVIPLLIFAQAAGTPANQQTGDLAWIAIETQRAYVAGVVAVAGDASGAFQPIIGKISEGAILRIVDAVVIVYRTEVHRTLVAMTSNDWDQPTDGLNYNINAWWHWYNEEYVPYKNEQTLLANLESSPPPPPVISASSKP